MDRPDKCFNLPKFNNLKIRYIIRVFDWIYKPQHKDNTKRIYSDKFILTKFVCFSMNRKCHWLMFVYYYHTMTTNLDYGDL